MDMNFWPNPNMAKQKIAPDTVIAENLRARMGAHVSLNTQPALANASGVGQTTIGRILRAEVNPTAENLRKLTKALGCTVSDLFGETNSTAKVTMRPVLTWEHEADLPEGEFAMIRRLGVRLSAGNGHEHIDVEIDEAQQPQAFRADWIRKMGLKPNKLACMVASGPSMETRIQDGDALVVDTSRTDVVDGKVFALWYDGGERVKRLYRLPGGGLRIKSDNAEFAPIDLTQEHIGHVHIIGQVVHVAGEGGL